MRNNGFSVEIKDDKDRKAIRDQFAVPLEIQSCHTAIVDGYIIEGHVPADEVNKLLAERPAIVGLAVIGMPPGSPGMEVESGNEVTFDVIAFDRSGNMEVFASYPK
jgi:hypothetical protein